MSKKKEKRTNRLDFYRNRDDTHPLNTNYEPPTEIFNGPADTDVRTCTDWGCIPVMIVFLLFCAAYAISAYQESDVRRIFLGYDFRADMCGVKQLLNKQYQYFLDPFNWTEISICVEQCPSAPDNTQEICIYNNTGNVLLEDYCYKTYFSQPYKKYCMPLQLGATRNAIEKIVTNDFTVAQRAGGDFLLNLTLIFGAFVLQIALGIVFVLILLGKRVAHIMLWACIFSFCVALALISDYIELEKDNAIQKDCPGPVLDSKTRQVLIPAPDPYLCIPNHLYFLDGIRYTMIYSIPVYVICMIASFHQILRMIQVMDKMIKPIRQLPHMMIVPALISMSQAALAIIFVIIFIGGISAGTVQTIPAAESFPPQAYRGVVQQVWQERGFYVLTFVYIWLQLAFSYFNRFFICCCSSIWYYARDKNYLNAPIMRPIYYGLRYHIGSFLLGSIVLSGMWMFNGMFYFLRLSIVALKKQRILQDMILNMTAPMFWIYEYIGKYVSNRNFMHMAVFGDNFWISGQKTFYLRIRNSSRISLVRAMVGYVRLIGMLFISSVGSYLVYFSLYSQQLVQPIVDTNTKKNVYIEYPIIPTLFVFFTGLLISQNFSSIIDIVAETVLFDLVADEEMFMGKQRFADQDMLEYANKFSKEKEKKEFVVTNNGLINPLNDRGDPNDIIKPINIKNLMGAQSDPEDHDDDENQDDEKNKKQKNNTDSQDEDDGQNKGGINMDELNARDEDGLDDDYQDEERRTNNKRVIKNGNFQGIEESDVRQVDLNYEGRAKTKKQNRFQF